MIGDDDDDHQFFLQRSNSMWPCLMRVPKWGDGSPDWSIWAFYASVLFHLVLIWLLLCLVHKVIPHDTEAMSGFVLFWKWRYLGLAMTPLSKCAHKYSWLRWGFGSLGFRVEDGMLVSSYTWLLVFETLMSASASVILRSTFFSSSCCVSIRVYLLIKLLLGPVPFEWFPPDICYYLLNTYVLLISHYI